MLFFAQFFEKMFFSFLCVFRAQDIFRQAMRSSFVCLEVLPSSNREIYERSLIGQLHGSSTGPNSSPHTSKTRGPPPPIKAKPMFKPPENPTARLTEEVPNPEGVSVSY